MECFFTSHTHSDYGYKRALGTTGPCIRDTDVVVSDPCVDNDDGATYDETTGYVIYQCSQ